MAKHYGKKKRKTDNTSRQSQSKQKLQSSSSNEINNSRCSDHPYATRSKTLTNSWSITCFTKTKRRKFRRLSDSSIICLGTYRKIPPFIDLEGTTDYSQQAKYEKLDD